MIGARPAQALAIVTCMDVRLDPLASMGLAPGDAHVLRNAGGVITEDIIRSLAVSQRALGTTRVMIVHHTDCGLMRLNDEEFRHELTRDAGVEPPFALHAFADAEAQVRASIARVVASPFLPYRDEVRGFVYDVASGTVREVSAPRD